jgi:hypothetical protein|tara:strand:+ start:207 stop:518 length:312 start_codon:yes stop_codon:yes gene_type:complete
MIAISDPTGFVDSVVTLAEQLLEIGVGDAMIMDGYDDCVIGVLERYGMEPIVLYDKEKVINKLVENGCDDEQGANEYYEFNQLGAWYGDKTPGFLIRLPKVDD